MTIFDYLTDIFVSKTGNLPLDGYVPYLVNRWLGFVNPTICLAINEQINNKFLLENKEMHYKTLIALIPKLSRCPRVHYLKKIKHKEIEEDFRINLIAQHVELSKREVTLLLNEGSMN